MNATPFSRLSSCSLHSGLWKMLIVMLIVQTPIDIGEQSNTLQLCQAYVYCMFLSLSLIPIFIPVFCVFVSFIFLFCFLKGSLSKSNTVSHSMRQLQSPASWSGPSILSPTSWLFKRAKAQQCSFLNTQIHPCTNRGTAVWQKSPPPPSLSLSPSLLTLDSDTLALLITHPPP